MIANLTLSTFLSYSFLSLHIISEANRYVIIRIFNEEIKMVKSFNWYVWRGENNKVINQDGTFEEKWVLLDIIDFDGAVLYRSEIA
jgi:hypothetical protein